MPNNYTKEKNAEYTVKLRNMLELLPAFASDFFRGITDTTQIRTRLAYSYDLRIFFYYLKNVNDKFQDRNDEKDFTVTDLDLIKAIDIEKYSEFLSYYQLPNYKDPSKMMTYTNSANGKMRKLATLRSFYKYYFKRELIQTNPAELVDLPKIHEKPIIRLEVNEVADLLDGVEDGNRLSETAKRFHEKTALRDTALIALMLGTGIRISECIGLNISDFDFSNNSFIVTRKGGDKAILYLSQEVADILTNYLQEYRNKIEGIKPGDEDAMFLSLQKKRMGVSAVEKMVKKYTRSIVPLKNISPHKFRSTFGTNLYLETGDIYLVADVLGHKDVNTTRKHYADVEEDRRKQAAKVIKLRKD